MNDKVIPLNEIGKIETVKVYNQSYVNKQQKRIAEQEELLNSTLEENKDIYKKMADLDTALEDCTESLTDARIKIKELEKENTELKERVKTLTIHDTNAVLNGLEMKVLKDSHRDRANKTQEQLTKAKEVIKKLSKSLFLAKGIVRDLIDDTVDFKESKERAIYCYEQEKFDIYKQAEQFLKECE